MTSIISDTLDKLIERVEEDVPDRPLDQLTTAVAASARLGHLGDMLVDHFVEAARAGGHSWAEIGTSMGVTRQAAQQRGPRAATAPKRTESGAEKPSPFAVWHWGDGDDSAIEVLVEPGQAWYRLVSLDGFDVGTLVAASKEIDPKQWPATLSNDLDDVYRRLGAELGMTVKAELRDAAGRTVTRDVERTIAKARVRWRWVRDGEGVLEHRAVWDDDDEV